jgi:putative addiction module component (TIGR02574 family)
LVVAVNIEELTIAERLDLISRLWDSIPDTVEDLPIPDWHRAEVERRLIEADASPENAVPWEQVKQELWP